MKYCSLLAALLPIASFGLLPATSFGATSFGATDWNSILDKNAGAKVFFGTSLEGREPFARNADLPFAPASTAKIFTASAILSLLGPDYRYPTRLEMEQTESTVTKFRLVGSGDPSWGMAEFNETLTTRVNLIATTLKNRGVREVSGEIEVASADPRWDSIDIPEGWKPADTMGCGGTLGQAFNLDLNCSTLKIHSPEKYSWVSGADTPVDLQLKDGTTTNLLVRLNHLPEGRLGYTVKGTWKRGSATRSYSLPVWGTHAWIKYQLQIALKKQGIALRPSFNPPSKGRRTTITFLSPNLAYLVKPFVKNSINFMGDAFLRTLAVESGRPEASLLAGGIAVIREHLLRAGVPDEFTLHDGSGLSRISLITPRAMLAFLNHLSGEPHFSPFWGSLAIAGIDGTLRNRMKGTAAAARLRGKTGTLNGVYNLAGYVPADGGGYVPFVLLTNTTTSLAGAARSAEDRVGVRLAQITPRQRRPEPLDPFPIYIPEHAGQDDQ